MSDVDAVRKLSADLGALLKEGTPVSVIMLVCVRVWQQRIDAE